MCSVKNHTSSDTCTQLHLYLHLYIYIIYIQYICAQYVKNRNVIIWYYKRFCREGQYLESSLLSRSVIYEYKNIHKTQLKYHWIARERIGHGLEFKNSLVFLFCILCFYAVIFWVCRFRTRHTHRTERTRIFLNQEWFAKMQMDNKIQSCYVCIESNYNLIQMTERYT